MALNSATSSRANIRIEIKNDLVDTIDEEMVEENGELSEGEIQDDEMNEEKNSEDKIRERNTIQFGQNVASSGSEKVWENGEDIDMCEKEEQEKLLTRAQRFGLDPAESKVVTDTQLQQLYDSLGISNSEEKDIRFDAIYMYGTHNMHTQDVFGYFGKYNPSSIEWINDISCNVVWHDKISTARAFLALSKPVNGMPVLEQVSQKNEESAGRSILLIDSEMENKENDEKEVNISDIKTDIPPGYWRLGYPHEKSEYILLRYAKRTERKTTENIEASRVIGLVSSSRKKRIKEIEQPAQKGNPWGSLARNWNYDIQESTPKIIRTVQEKPFTGLSKSLKERIGETPKRQYSEEEDEKEEKKSKIPRMKMYADEEEARIQRAKELKQIKVLEDIEHEITQKVKVQDLRNRLGKRDIKEDRRKYIKPILRKEPTPEKSTSENSDSEEEVRVQQRSKVAVVVKRPQKPSVASTVWSRLAMEKERQRVKIKQESESDKRSSSSSESDYSDSDDENYTRRYKRTLTKPVGERPGFKNGDLKSRLGFQNKEHKSPLRIEINNDHYKKEK